MFLDYVISDLNLVNLHIEKVVCACVLAPTCAQDRYDYRLTLPSFLCYAMINLLALLIFAKVRSIYSALTLHYSWTPHCPHIFG
jgi:Ni/Fe-hydrogenase subunit HybB-like protein